MRIKKAPCLAWIRQSQFKENVGLVVEVLSRAPDIGGNVYWYVKTTTPAFAKDSQTGEPWQKKVLEGLCDDYSLTPINDPDLPVEDVDTAAPKEKEKIKFDFDLKEKEDV